MRGRGITSGRRAIRPDGIYYRQTRRRRVGGRRRVRLRLSWAAMTIAVITLIVIIVWILR